MAVSTKTQLTLKGSTEIVAEFFHYSINSILYQRGIYPPEEFNRESKYGLAMMVSTDEKLRDYMRKVLNDLEGWLLKGEVQQLVVVINGIDSGETLERWVFQVEQARDKENGGLVQQQTSKSKKEISGEISALLRQITATVTFLPMLDEQCAFDILIYTNKDTVVPVQWQESDAQMVKNAAEVRLRSFDTKIHKVETAVAYRELCDDDI
mmetsp:Transcript_20190/g.45736  ORF Transcript_20190/g.45736 Transcript_20190/m.45736 type:complete len:209 (+) Transcript_20190:188-814(+)|eukprot:CAMPEP_0172615268 /NCGR_PEP_ID=MMETSP1068-20121228/57147_1 /TAXON_ID=35684 /ORGANISM="Pseudopedinella elastica, Strain CCMP716" /LENGTH=208 /DNA_ID=CAMNT_0013420345 /DNA_START=168 /DNA_END=794 /DNA_ORIENTATION=+